MAVEDSSEEEAEVGQEMFTLRRRRHDPVDQSVQERRRELIYRFYLAQGGADVGNVDSSHSLRTFSRPDSAVEGATLAYEWWDAQRVSDAGILAIERRAQPLSQSEPGRGADLGPFKQLLEEHHIDVCLFGRGEAKTLGELCAEVCDGRCRLMLDATEHKKLVRVVDFVGVRLFSRAAPWSRRRLLVETGECYADGRRRELLRLPGTKRRPHENARQTAARIVREMLAMADGSVELDHSGTARFEAEFESPSYPGVRTVYRKEIVVGTVRSGGQQVGLPGFSNWSITSQDGTTKAFAWLSEASAPVKEVYTATSVSSLVRAPVGLSEEALRAQLASMGVDTAGFGRSSPAPRLVVLTLARAVCLSEEVLSAQLSAFGVFGRARTLEEFSAELIRGEASLASTEDGRALRVVEVVHLVLQRPTGEVLVQASREEPDGSVAVLNRLPGAKCRPGEHHFHRARRILHKQLGIDEAEVAFESEALSVQERWHSGAYPGLETLCRKRIVRATLEETAPPGGAAARSGLRCCLTAVQGLDSVG